MINLPVSATAIAIAAALALLGVAPAADEQGVPRMLKLGVDVTISDGGVQTRLDLPAATVEFGDHRDERQP